MGYVAAGSGPTVVALHGGLLSGRLTFGPVLADWVERLRLLVPDRRGYERTPGVAAGTMAEQARDLLAFVERHADGRAHVVGTSYGGMVALTALQLDRGAFASLTVVEAPAVTLCGRDRDALELRAWLTRLYETSTGGDPRGAGRDFFAVMDPRALGRIEALLATDDRIHVALDELLVWRTPLSPVGLAGNTVPVAVVTGGRSVPGMHAIGQHVATATGGEHHVVAAAGHAAHLIGRPFRDLLCAHVADAEAAQSWDDAVALEPWTAEWETRFEVERAAIAAALGDDAVAIAHIGSTAVPGLSAKPIVDIAVGVADTAATHAVVDRLRALGYAWFDDPKPDHDHRFLLRRADGRRLVHLHVVSHNRPWWRDRIAFRDALRADTDLRDRYVALKRGLAERHAGDREAYTDAKTAFVNDVVRAPTS